MLRLARPVPAGEERALQCAWLPHGGVAVLALHAGDCIISIAPDGTPISGVFDDSLTADI
jgi:hypothetical protein